MYVIDEYLGSKRVDDEEVEWMLKDTYKGISFFDLSIFLAMKGSIN